MDIATKLSWELVALNDRGNTDEREMLAHEIAYGIALKCDGITPFREVITSIINQITDTTLQSCLRKIVVRLTK